MLLVSIRVSPTKTNPSSGSCLELTRLDIDLPSDPIGVPSRDVPLDDDDVDSTGAVLDVASGQVDLAVDDVDLGGHEVEPRCSDTDVGISGIDRVGAAIDLRKRVARFLRNDADCRARFTNFRDFVRPLARPLRRRISAPTRDADGTDRARETRESHLVAANENERARDAPRMVLDAHRAHRVRKEI